MLDRVSTPWIWLEQNSVYVRDPPQNYFFLFIVLTPQFLGLLSELRQPWVQTVFVPQKALFPLWFLGFIYHLH